ncbi:hypothetical protein CYMTET_46134 [Cymbomonas tetramitiformis]|uniref:K Homology domain-containing protein n=1 Tax=Cymbomonas tetramitiformis TaxID=36881 RepID=A0AAE0BWT6_9CHLO|nr:hypothetical protein CYMTET_46134 [Cymbomonas tetramitiformis]
MADASLSLSESVRSDDHAKFADFIISCKNGDSEGAVEFLRQVVLTIDPSGLKPALSRKKQRTDTPVKTDPTPASIITETALDLSYHVGDEVDAKPATTLLLIPNKTAVIAAVIGKSGSQISHIQKSSGAKVQVEKTENKSVEYVEVTITGTVSTNDTAQAMIMQKVVSAVQAKDMPAETTAYNNMLVVPNQAVRYLIGKGGSTIKELQSASGAHVQFEAEKGMKPGAAGRQVTIQASTELSKNRCTYLIIRKIAEDAKVDINWVPKKESRTMAPSLPSSSEQNPGLAGLDYNPFHGILPPQQNMLQNYLPQQQMSALSNK